MRPGAPFSRMPGGYELAFLALLAFRAIFNLIYIGSGVIDLAPDEAHYWEWSRNLDLSYYSKGPMVAYLIFGTTKIFGANEFGVRFGAVALYVATSVLIYRFARDMFESQRTAFFGFLIFFAAPLFSAGGILMTIDSPLFFFWAAALCSIRRALWGRRFFWYAAGAFIGLGLLSKYTMVAFIPSLFIYLSLSSKNSTLLRKKEPYIAVLISLLIFAPVIIWNLQNNWVSLRHLLGAANLSKGFSLSPRPFLQFLLSQAAFISPLLFAGLLWGMWRSLKLGVRGSQDDHLFLFSFAAPLFIFYLVLSFYAKVQGNWPAIAYLTAAISASAAFWQLIANNPSRVKWRALSGLAAITIALGAAETAAGYNTSVLRLAGINLQAKYDPTARLKGWRELGDRLSELYGPMAAKNHTFIFSDTYQTASEAAFYTKGNPRTYNVNIGRRKNQYDFWPGFESFVGSDAIYIQRNNKKIARPVMEACKEVVQDPPLPIYKNGFLANTFYIFRCYGFKGMTSRPEGPIKY